MLMMAAIAAFAQPAHYITFNGTDQYMRIPHHEDFNIAADESFTLTGWVRNEYDGSVSMEIQGEEENIDKVILAIEAGRYVQIENMDNRTIPVAEGEYGFRTR